MLYDYATAMSQGRREYQEDSLAANFCVGDPYGFVVLADGMGGHAAGDVASKIVVTEVFSELKFKLSDYEALEKNIGLILHDIVQSTNECIREHVKAYPDHHGMGSTLVAPIFFEDRLYWISVGDSPLFHFRDGALSQINQDHSMAPQIDMMLKTGQIDEETARNHPDRNCLTSVIMGANIPHIDCRLSPKKVESGDILIAASDGLQYLTNAEIEEILSKNEKKPGVKIATELLEAVMQLDDPDQDNISIAVIKID
ncbi:MAG: serine/threonine-protein phosphatase [Rhodobacteraceae bacterium]|nr:serine/threonine-protein phosphatase [Paracoccaceae bacterium]